MGSPDSERDREDNEPQHERTIPHSFAIATKEVTIAEFRRVFPHHVQSSRYSPSDDCPALGATWYEAMMYCRWLSEQEALETSYPSRDVIEQRLAARQAISLEKNPLHCPGYRLPTEAEWEFACRADTATSRCCGSADVLLDHYGWYGRNATERARPVGLLKPNDFGLFDVHGNAYEWCHTQGGNHLKGHSLGDIFIAIENSRVIRGGAFFEPAKHLRAAQRDVLLPATSLQSVGFRVARTLHK